MLTKQEILAAASSPLLREAVAFKDFGTFLVRQLTGLECDRWQEGWERWRREVNGDLEDHKFFTEFLLAWVLVDEQGNPLFDPSNVEEVRRLAGLPARVSRKLWQVARRLNGLGAEEEAALEKNSASGRSEPSPSGSASGSVASTSTTSSPSSPPDSSPS